MGEASAVCEGDRPFDVAANLRALSDRLRTAHRGNATLDAVVGKALFASGFAPQEPGANWTTGLSQALQLLPADCNFSAGRRDGICWAWIQPNDAWQPGEYEARHDHPGGSGLVVAATAALALTAAWIALLAARLDQAGSNSTMERPVNPYS